jgi:hypothetical protein
MGRGIVNKDLNVIKNYIDLYERLISIGVPKDASRVVSLIYNANNINYIEDAFLDLTNLIKKRRDFSTIDNNLAYIFSGLLIVKFEYPFLKVNPLLKLIDEINNAGFDSKIVSFMAYAIIDKKNTNKIIQNTKEIFDLIQENHSFITNEYDYLHSIFLAMVRDDFKSVLSEVEYYHIELSKRLDIKKDYIQFISNQLVLLNTFNEKDELILKIAYIFKSAEEKGIKLKQQQQLILYMLIFEKDIDKLLDEIFYWKSNINKYIDSDSIIKSNIWLYALISNICNLSINDGNNISNTTLALQLIFISNSIKYK